MARPAAATDVDREPVDFASWWGFGRVLAIVGVRALVSFLPAGFPRTDAIHVNAFVLSFTVLVALATGVVFGLVPASRLRVPIPAGTARRRKRFEREPAPDAIARGTGCGRSGIGVSAARRWGLMLRSFVNLLRLDPGFRRSMF